MQSLWRSLWISFHCCQTWDGFSVVFVVAFVVAFVVDFVVAFVVVFLVVFVVVSVGSKFVLKVGVQKYPHNHLKRAIEMDPCHTCRSSIILAELCWLGSVSWLVVWIAL